MTEHKMLKLIAIRLSCARGEFGDLPFHRAQEPLDRASIHALRYAAINGPIPNDRNIREHQMSVRRVQTDWAPQSSWGYSGP